MKGRIVRDQLRPGGSSDSLGCPNNLWRLVNNAGSTTPQNGCLLNTLFMFCGLGTPEASPEASPEARRTLRLPDPSGGQTNRGVKMMKPVTTLPGQTSSPSMAMTTIPQVITSSPFPSSESPNIAVHTSVRLRLSYPYITLTHRTRSITRLLHPRYQARLVQCMPAPQERCWVCRIRYSCSKLGTDCRPLSAHAPVRQSGWPLAVSQSGRWFLGTHIPHASQCW